MTNEQRMLDDSRRDWIAVRDHVAGGHEGFGPGLIQQARENYERDLLARIEALMDARAGTPEGDELRALADEWIEHESAASLEAQSTDTSETL